MNCHELGFTVLRGSVASMEGRREVCVSTAGQVKSWATGPLSCESYFSRCCPLDDV